MRRTIGKSSEWTPAERVGYWIAENAAKSILCLVSIVVACLFTNLVINKFINFMALGSAMEHTEDMPYSADHPVATLIKGVLALFLIWLFFRRRTTI